MSFPWQRFLGLFLLTAIAILLWLLTGSVIVPAFYSAALLFLTIRHIRYLTALDTWLRAASATASLPDGDGVWGDVFTSLSRLIRMQSQSQQQLTTALERLQRATSAMPEGVVILDESDRIEWCNPVAEKHFGIDFKRDAAQHITYLVRQPQFASYLSTQNFSEPLVIRRNGELVLSLQLVPYGDKEKLLISRDITHLERIEEIRRDFVANVSHELRTPLTVVGGFLETMQEEQHQITGGIGRRAIPLMIDQTTRMRRLVEDLLTLSRLENTQHLAREDRVDVIKIIHNLHLEGQSLSEGMHRISQHCKTDAMLLGNADEIRSILGNLVSNAVRYTPKDGEIILTWAIRENGEGEFSVQDSGIGIEPEHIPRLTERFYRVDRSRSRETGGTGLGLAIVKHALNCHQARLEVVSEPGKGSRFSACFPAKRVVMAESLLVSGTQAN